MSHVFLQEQETDAPVVLLDWDLGVGLFREYGLLITLCFNSFLKRKQNEN